MDIIEIFTFIVTLRSTIVFLSSTYLKWDFLFSYFVKSIFHIKFTGFSELGLFSSAGFDSQKKEIWFVEEVWGHKK